MPKFNKPPKRTIVQLAILFVVVVACFYPALGSWFVADDIWQVNFAHNVLSGRYDLIWRNFTSNYLQLPSFGFYRPLLGLTFLFDFFVWKVNASGYHLTSLVLYTSAVYLLFALMRRMTRSWPDSNSSWAAFFSALLFAVCPLHVEDVTWISGRADLLAAPFFLLSLILLVASHQEKRRAPYFLALFCFVCALLSREISIGLPVLAFAYYMTWPEEEQFKDIVSKVRTASLDSKQEEEQTAEDSAKPKKPPSARQVAHMEREIKKAKRKKKQNRRAESEEIADKGGEALDEPVQKSQDESVSASSAETTNDTTNGAPPVASKWTLSGRLLLACRMTWPFVVISVVYLFIRLQALGTVVGGYGGMMGGALDRDLLLRWFDLNNIIRIVLPIPQSLTTSMMFPHWILLICLASCLGIIVIRLIAQANPLRWIVFLMIWMIVSIVPLGVGVELETGRLLFFFTMAYSALWPVLLFHPTRLKARYSLPREANTNLGITSALVFFVMTFVMGWATYNSNLIWQAAGHEMQRLMSETVQLAESQKDNEESKIIVLGIPKDYKGAHENFNGSTFHHMLRPPFTQRSISEKIITFEPFIFGPYEVINTRRFNELLRNDDVLGPYVWSRNDLRYHPIEWGGELGLPEVLPLPVRASGIGRAVGSVWSYQGKGTSEIRGNGITMHNTENGARLQIDQLSIHPQQYDFLEFDLKGTLRPDDKSALAPMAIGWNSLSVDKDRSENWSVVATNVPKLKDGDHVRVQLSHFWQWYSAGKITSLVIGLFAADTVEVSNIRLVKRDHLTPYAGLYKLKPLNSGEYVIKDEKVLFVFDGSNVTNARSAQIEVTKPNFFFDNYLMGTTESAVSATLNVERNMGKVALPPSLFPEPAYYEVRVRCLDGEKKPTGTWSDSVTLLKMGDGLDTYVF